MAGLTFRPTGEFGHGRRKGGLASPGFAELPVGHRVARPSPGPITPATPAGCISLMRHLIAKHWSQPYRYVDTTAAPSATVVLAGVTRCYQDVAAATILQAVRHWKYDLQVFPPLTVQKKDSLVIDEP